MSRKILLADDSLTIQKVVELTFSDSDYDLVCVGNGLRAVEALEGERPDLVLADVVMPEKNGYEVCEAIKSNPATAKIPVVLLTGTFEPFDRERAERIGADAIVSKPFDSQQLLTQVEELLARAPAASTGATTAAIPQIRREPSPPPPPPPAPAHEDPFDVGFQAEDFTGAFRAPAAPPAAEKDLFEDFGGQDPDRAVEAIEKEHPELAMGRGAPAPTPAPAEPPPPPGPASAASLSKEPSWLEESGSRHRRTRTETEEEAKWVPETAPDDAFAFSSPESAAPAFTFETPSASGSEEVLEDTAGAGAPAPAAAVTAPAAAIPPPREEREEEVVVDVPSSAAGVPHELESLAKRASIPELARMLTTELSSGGGGLSDDEIERVAEKVVQKLSDRIIREIAWEVIPDMAEIVIKQRIRELEAGAE
ncbi:MAG TPA: response regulator [Thermoanaerobaculia bacterium]|jgi:CheY-like chemotaxis protein